MAGIPVSTLRIWERRYRVVAPPQTVSGHRLYCGHDVQRLVLIKRLIGLGHAVGTIAMLELEQLEQLAASRAVASPLSPTVPVMAAAAPTASLRADQRLSLVTVGSNLVQRIGSVRMHSALLADRLNVVAACADLSQAETSTGTASAELLLVQLNTLHAESADRVLVLARRLGARRVIVLYGFGPERVVQTLRATGAQPRREPVPEHELAAMLAEMSAAGAPGASAANTTTATTMSSAPAAPRRFSDQALADLAVQATSVACECPRHLTELVGQLASFEKYSVECLNRNAGDAALHADLHHVASSARAMFESALERVAHAEGLELPPRPADDAFAGGRPVVGGGGATARSPGAK